MFEFKKIKSQRSKYKTNLKIKYPSLKFLVLIFVTCSLSLFITFDLGSWSFGYLIIWTAL
ncbi:hypothetical protein A2291_08195 [candidate division WOR-1 bacterium RIFOXYB2_FULL_42_35]|nr:MAG: hypothetical protein A2247_01880 [candidate division WOR-1 bacterium RIFOXYA2_FULL_41_14]OGC24067.1 MAG: hypothetical protein A2291_08195 [candidate division WOR-1 bacterium RIFOXYB2_FULL_42_35]